MARAPRAQQAERTMRAGIDLTPLAAPRSGVGHFVYYQVQALLAHPGAPQVLGFSSGRRRPDTAGLGTLAQHWHLPLPTRALYRLWDWTGQPRVDTHLGGLDLYHATNYYLPPVRAARTVLTVYDLAFLRMPEVASPKVVGPFSAGLRRFATAADHIAVCSDATRLDVVTLLGVPEERVTVVYGAPAPGFEPRPRHEAAARLAEAHGLSGPFILFVGTLEPRKNLVRLLRAFAGLREVLPHTLVLIGRDGWHTAPIHAALDDPRLAGRVRRMGFLRDHTNLVDFYAAADVLALPSLYEGYGLPVIEAMACGCPVVVSRAGSLPEVGGEAAEYVDALDEADIARGLRAVAGDPRRRAHLTVAGVEHSRHFTWGAAAEETLALYRSVL